MPRELSTTKKERHRPEQKASAVKMAKRVMKLVAMLPEELQSSAMAFGMRAALDPHLVSAAMLPVALTLAYVPHLVKVALTLKNYNIEEPRAADAARLPRDDGQSALLRRCVACHANALEGFGPFAAAVLAAKLFIDRKNKRSARKAAVLAMKYVCLILVDFDFFFLFLFRFRFLSW